MAKITKARGLTQSVRTRRTVDATAVATVSAVAAVTATPDQGLEVVALEVPSGTVKQIVDWIGDDPDRAEAARSHSYKGVRDHVATVLGG